MILSLFQLYGTYNVILDFTHLIHSLYIYIYISVKLILLTVISFFKIILDFLEIEINVKRIIENFELNLHYGND